MALLKNDKMNKSATVKQEHDTDRHVQDTPEATSSNVPSNTSSETRPTPAAVPANKSKIKATDRKNIKVDPGTYSKLKILANTRNAKLYELMDELVNSYVNQNLTDREKAIFEASLQQK